MRLFRLVRLLSLPNVLDISRYLISAAMKTLILLALVGFAIAKLFVDPAAPDVGALS